MIDLSDLKADKVQQKLGNIEITTPGWFGLLSFFHRGAERVLSASNKNGVIHYWQVKEKFGDLRIHHSLFSPAAKKLYDETSFGDRYEDAYREKMEEINIKVSDELKETINALARLASYVSTSVCMGCGRPSGIVRSKTPGWINNLCETCSSLNSSSTKRFDNMDWIVPDVTLSSLRAGCPEYFEHLMDSDFLTLLKRSPIDTPSTLPETVALQMDKLLSLSIEDTLERDHGFGVRPIHYLRPAEDFLSLLEKHQYVDLLVADDNGQTWSKFLKKYDTKGFDGWLRMQAGSEVTQSHVIKI